MAKPVPCIVDGCSRVTWTPGYPCLECWRQVPGDLRSKAWEAWTVAGVESGAHRLAVAEAVAALEAIRKAAA